MAIVPRQQLADDEVIEFWKKKTELTESEMAALAGGVNPFAWENIQERMKLSQQHRQMVEDVLTVLCHRIPNHLDRSRKSRREWERVFARCELAFPDHLREPMPEHLVQGMRAIDEFLADTDGIKKLLEDDESRRGKPILLRQWFLRDSWTAKEAMMLLCGLDPDGTVVGVSENIFGKELDRLDVAYTLDGFEYGPKSIYGDRESNVTGDFERAWEQMSSIWFSGDHKPRNPPAYYLEWAASKGLLVPWLDWARENGLIDTRSSSIDKPPTAASFQHRSHKLMLMLLAADRFWANADRDDRDTHPTNEMVAEWLVSQGFSKALADKAATILRPDWVPLGRRPD